MNETPSIAPCPYELWDGSYVVGALSPAERREYEAHLDGCVRCSRAVRDLAGLPGLLGRIGPEVFETAVEEPLPETLMPRLVRETRRRDRRRIWLTAGAAAAAAAVVAVGGTVVLDQSTSGTPTSGIGTHASSPAQPAFRQMRSFHTDPMSASLAVSTVPWGTKLDLHCSYPAIQGDYLGGSYALEVHTRDGHTERVASWNGLPGKSMELTAATASSQAQITSVVLTKADGTPVARLGLPAGL